VIVIPENAWEAMLDGFAETIANVERIAFLDGIRTAGQAVVTTVVFPDAVLMPGTYDVSAEAMSAAGHHMRQHQLARLAQVHTHGGPGCGHSGRDDDMAYTQREGAISIVLPDHAIARPRPLDGTVHLRTAAGWTPLDASEAEQAVGLVPSVIDQRSHEWIVSPIVTSTPSMGGWRRLARLLRRR
jgi:hypothetical protein